MITQCPGRNSYWPDGNINRTAIIDMSLTQHFSRSLKCELLFLVWIARPSVSDWQISEENFQAAFNPSQARLFFSFFSVVLDMMVSRDLLPLCQVGTDTYKLTVKHGGNMQHGETSPRCPPPIPPSSSSAFPTRVTALCVHSDTKSL